MQPSCLPARGACLLNSYDSVHVESTQHHLIDAGEDGSL